MERPPTVKMEWTGKDWLIYANASLVAKCQEGDWTSLKPGWTVKTNASRSKILVTHNGTTLEYGVPKHRRKTLMHTTIEQPTVGPDGEPLWRATGARQRYAQRLVEEVDHGRMFVAACQVLFHRKLKLGEIGTDDAISPSTEEVANVIAWCDLRQLRLLRKIAESLIVTEESPH
jgi:hypothetical protein